MSYTRIDGPAGTLNVDDGGSGGVPVVFLHSFAGTSAHWSKQLDHMRKTRRAVALDLRGHGKSAKPAHNDYSVESQVQDVATVVDALGLERFVMVGHSMGGTTAAAYAGANPNRVAGLIFAETPGRTPEQQSQSVLAALEQDFDKTMESYWTKLLTNARPEVLTQIQQERRSVSRDASMSILRAIFASDPSVPLARFKGPKLAITTSTENPQALHRQAPGVEHDVIAGTSHWMQLDKPDESIGSSTCFSNAWRWRSAGGSGSRSVRWPAAEGEPGRGLTGRAAAMYLTYKLTKCRRMENIVGIETIAGRIRHTRLQNESEEYLTKRETLRVAELDLMRSIERVAALRRALPQGTPVKDYTFIEGPASLDDGDAPLRTTRLSDLFTNPKRPLVIYHFMYGKQNTAPCPMCTMSIDGYNGVAHHLAQNVDFAIVAAAEPAALRAHARARGWHRLRLLSAGDSTFKYDFRSEDEDGRQDSAMSVFTRDADGTVRHFYTNHPWFSDEVRERAQDLAVPVYNILDLTPQGRGDWYASLEYGTAINRPQRR